MKILTGQSTEDLIRGRCESLQRLLVLLEALENPTQRAVALEQIRHIADIEGELQERNVADLMRHAEMIKQFRTHGERLWNFITRLAQICIQHDFAASRPVFQSFTEYMEAWERRTVPTEAEFRQRLESRIREKEEQLKT